MNQPIPSGMEIADGINLDISETGAWIVRANDDAFPLEDMRDFFRAWLLLERPFEDVKASLDRGPYSANPATPFPFWKLIGAALMAGTRQWTDHAMTWVPFLTMAEKARLKDLFIEVRDSKWASQKNRQLARKYANEIERSEHSSAN
ncbi:hypothetical protein [Bradyrhizobium sp. AUGA SZCCT0431]|uniref:hypothetical protein n=1 Tax=Bradyrhizobium sp. AUGA SZCCT0431 TaxID=2807674 RepID=UPI001BAC0BBF|nr:hypothetical protein [Bradyrhizobium sp. AUGA SZCCT0431]MBR1143833.1 hypothetical protein [Bradyrhizobium sp. AUGA SZCCT0431]